MFFKNGNTCWPLQNTCIPEVSQFIYRSQNNTNTLQLHTLTTHQTWYCVLNDFSSMNLERRRQINKISDTVWLSFTAISITYRTRARIRFFLPDIVDNMTNGQFTCTSIWRHLSAINITLGQHNYFLKSRLLLINHDNFFVISTNSHFKVFSSNHDNLVINVCTHLHQLFAFFPGCIQSCLDFWEYPCGIA